jgi:group I intron endonuclease
MINNNKNNFNKICLINVTWIGLGKNGLIEDSSKLNNKAAIYIFIYIHNNSQFYIGSTFNLARRIYQHRYYINNSYKSCPKFYNFIRKHGWENFKLGVLENINISEFNHEDKHSIKNFILEKEEYYFKKLNPTLNINKPAVSTLGSKHSQEMRKNMGLQRRGKSINWSRKDYIVSSITKNNLSLSARNGIKVKVFDEYNNIVNIFPTITSAAKYYDLDHFTLRKYINQGYSINNLRFEGELKDLRVWVFDKECHNIGEFSTANKAAKFYNVSYTTFNRYLKSKKLWKNKFYFSRTNLLHK